MVLIGYVLARLLLRDMEVWALPKGVIAQVIIANDDRHVVGRV